MSSFHIEHPENEDCIATPSRSEYEPRSRHGIKQADWKSVAEANDQKASALHFFITIVKTSSTSFAHAVIFPPKLPEIVSKLYADIFHASFKENLSVADLEIVNEIAADQASTDKWYQYRHAVITASSANDVLVKLIIICKSQIFHSHKIYVQSFACTILLFTVQH